MTLLANQIDLERLTIGSGHRGCESGEVPAQFLSGLDALSDFLRGMPDVKHTAERAFIGVEALGAA